MTITKAQLVAVAAAEGVSMVDLLTIVADARDGWIPPTFGKLATYLKHTHQAVLTELFNDLDKAFTKGITRKEQYIFDKEVVKHSKFNRALEVLHAR